MQADILSLQEHFSDPLLISSSPEISALIQRVSYLSQLIENAHTPNTQIRSEILHLQKEIKSLQTSSLIPQAGASLN